MASSSRDREPVMSGNTRFKRAAAPEPQTPPHFKRVFTADDHDETSSMAQARAAKRAKQSVRLETPHSDPLTGSSDLMPLLQPTDAEANILPKVKPGREPPSLITRCSVMPSKYPDPTIEWFKTAINQLHRDLQAERAMREQRELKIKQDMMLDLLSADKKVSKAEHELDRQRRHNVRLEELFREKLSRLEKDLQTEKAKHLKATNEANACRIEAEHLQLLTATLEEDLDELRRIENESAAKRRDDSQGLPPAYGSLDDADRLPPYNQHQDGGSLEVASFKREIRGNFMKRVAAAQAKARLLGAGTAVEKARVGSEMFYYLSRSLAEACADLEKILVLSNDVTVGYWKLLQHADGRHEHMVVPGAAKRSYSADRIAKLIIDLAWRVLSAQDIRPATITLDQKSKSIMALNYTDIDEKLLSALRVAFEDQRPIFELQHYLTQVNALRAQFHLLRAAIGYQYFSKSWLWLGEQVEVERQIQAASARSASAATLPGSELSSEPVEPLSESDSQDVPVIARQRLRC